MTQIVGSHLGRTAKNRLQDFTVREIEQLTSILRSTVSRKTSEKDEHRGNNAEPSCPLLKIEYPVCSKR